MQEDTIKKAKQRVKAKKEFYEHLSTYIVMGVFFFVLNAITAPGRWWFFWPILGWGIGVFFHYLNVFGIPGLGQFGHDWEREALKKEIERLKEEEGEWINEPTKLDLEDQPLPQRDPSPKWKDEDLV